MYIAPASPPPKTGSLNRRVRTDAALALTGRWSMPVLSVFLLFGSFALLLLLPEAAFYLLDSYLPALGGLNFWLSALLFALLLWVTLWLLAPFSFGMDCYYDALATADAPDPALVTTRNGVDRRTARRCKLRIWSRQAGLLLFFGLLLAFLTFCSGVFFAPKAVLSTLPEGVSLPAAIRALGVQPLLAVVFALLDLLAVWGALRALIQTGITGWLAGVLLAQGRVQTPTAALQQSRRLLTPHKALLAAFVRSFLLRFASCILVLPLFAVLPKYRAGRAILCRYCMEQAGL